jgi:hypothetical protein
MAVLRVVDGPMAGREISLDREEFVVGRGEEGSGGLGGDPELSRRHARFSRRDADTFVVEDLGSTNGTFVNGRRRTGPRVLYPGDTLKLGETTLTFEAEGAGARPTATARPAPVPEATAAPPAAHPVRRLLLVGALAAAIVVAVVVLSSSGKAKKAATTSSLASDCGAAIGRDGPVAYVVYVESNIARTGENSVIAMPYRAGDMKPLAMSQCPTGGSGSTDLTDSGVLDANDQLLTNPGHTLLFAVNQGSDSIAVFHIGPTGALTPVSGSPFPSGGVAPSSLGLSGSTLVVANKAQDGVRDLSRVAPSYTTFTVSAEGRLTPVRGSSVAALPGSSPTDASVAPGGGVAFATEESGPIRGFSVGRTGVLTQAPGSPYDPPAIAYPPGFDPTKRFALGVAAHPSRRLLFVGLSTIPALAVYRYDPTGKLTYLHSVHVDGSYLPCWIQVTRDGHWLYTSNADTDNLTTFDISNPTRPRQIQTFAFTTPGNPWNLVLDPTDRFLFVNTPRDTFKVPEGQGNTQHVLRIGADGRLAEVKGSPVAIPVPRGANPQGIAIVAPSR